jgi:shikimate dehydrogenase
MTRLGVLGWPVAHSRSPAMHNAALAALGLRDWHYQRLPVPPELFAETTRALGRAGFLGANVTIPHKEAALALANEPNYIARAIGAANTLTFREGTIVAENTDAPGLIEAMARAWGGGAERVGAVAVPSEELRASHAPERGESASPVKGRSVLVLGAGGSARAAVWALIDAGASEVSVWNRTPRRAAELAKELGARAVQAPVGADILVNCTSVGLQRSATEVHDPLQGLGLTADRVGEYSHVVDLVYSDAPTPLLAAAERAGVRTLGGLDILLAQGALSLERWTGLVVPRDVMRRALEQAP